MQRASHPTYTYDSTGHLTNFTPSGGTNDIVSEHVLLDPRIAGPRSLIAGGLRPTILNEQTLFTPPLSMSSPPVKRGGTTAASLLGYTGDKKPEEADIYGLTTAKPFISIDRRVRNLADNSTIVGSDKV